MVKKVEYCKIAFSQMWNAGIPLQEMAAHFGVSKGFISRHAHMHGLLARNLAETAPRKSRIKDCSAFRKAWDSALSYKAIGAMFGCSADAAKRTGIKYGYPKRDLRRAPVAKAQSKVREDVRRVAVTTVQSSINEAAVSHVSLSKEPWAHDSEVPAPQGGLA